MSDEPTVDFPIESETDIVFAVAEVLSDAVDNGIDEETAQEAAMGYIKGRELGSPRAQQR